MQAVKSDFPIFKKNPNLIYLDSAATSLKPQCVIDAVSDYYSDYPGNVHRGLYALSQRATEAYEGARATVQKFLGAKSEREIIFTGGTTGAINLVALGWGGQNLKRDDEIILTTLEHHSNIVPWQLIAKKHGCHIKFLDCDKQGMLKLEKLSALITRRTKIISLTHVSNAIGTIVPLKQIIQKAHAVGAKILVDAAQSVPHMPVNVEHIDCDFLAFSGHKMCGPTGIGVLYAKESILEKMEPLQGGGNMIREVKKNGSTWNDLPWKFEAGTPPIASAIGLGTAIKYLEGIGMAKIQRHGAQLLEYALATLGKIPCVIFYGPCDTKNQNSILSFGVDGIHPHDIATILDSENIAVRAGHHCAMPLMELLKIPATVRISPYIYNTENDIDKLALGILKAAKIFNINSLTTSRHHGSIHRPNRRSVQKSAQQTID